MRFTIIVPQFTVHLGPNDTVNVVPAELSRMFSFAGQDEPPWPAEGRDVREVGRDDGKNALERSMHGGKTFQTGEAYRSRLDGERALLGKSIEHYLIELLGK